MAKAWGPVLLAIVAGLALAAPPAAAFEALRNALSRLPASAAGAEATLVFDFVAPRLVRDWALRDHPGSGNDGVNAALLDPDAAAALTGIDFPALDTVLTFGFPPPSSVIFLAGPELSNERVAAAFRARGFEETAGFGTVIFVRGEDNHMDIAARDRADPFGANMGMAQRVAVGPLGIVVARAWDPLEDALPMATAEAPRSDADQASGVLLAALAAAAAARDPGAVAYAAEGFGAGAFGAPQGASGGLSGFALALFIVAEGEAEEAVHLVVAFADAGAAAAAAPVLAERLRQFTPAGVREQARFETAAGGAGGTIAVATIVFDRSDAHPAAREFVRWRAMTLRGQFAPLAE